jgi:hypothetical protein
MNGERQSPKQDTPGADWRSLIDFGLARTTAQRLAGLLHVTPDVVARWLRYCQLRGPDSFRNPNVFLLSRLNRNDYSAPSWSALQWLEQQLKQEGRDTTQQEEA